MIEYIKGEIVELSLVIVVIDCNGLGYVVNILFNIYFVIQGKSSCKFYIYEVICEDVYVLYGFVDKQEWEFFLLLIFVLGIGGNMVCMIFFVFLLVELVNVISIENVNMLKMVKGIGLKIVQCVIVDLKDKIKIGVMVVIVVGGVVGVLLLVMNVEVQEEVIVVLIMFGFVVVFLQKVVFVILKEEFDVLVEKVIKLVLKRF